LVGENTGDQFGASVSSAGDINLDGYADFIASAPLYDGAAGADSGKVYIYSGLTKQLLFTLEGENSGDQFGYQVSGGGDLNDDGIPDVAVSAIGFDEAVLNNCGKVYVYSGADQTLLFAVGEKVSLVQFGFSINISGDYDGDGRNDLIVGAPMFDGAAGTDTGKAYVYSGSAGLPLFSQEGLSQADEYGHSVSFLTDLNSDGFDEIIVGAPMKDDGVSYVYSGVDSSLMYLQLGETPNAKLGLSVNSAGDFNGDGIGDYMVGSPGHNGFAGTSSGKVYVFSGSDNQLLYSVEGSTPDSPFGYSLTSGLLNANNVWDLIIGSPTSPDGRVYLHLK
jgi:hypothetical protein